MAYLGRKGAVAPLTSGDIPDGVIEGRDIAFFENGSTTQNLSGTYSTERMYLNDSYTLTGDVTITGHLALGTVADSDVVITNDSSARTITGSGTLDGGNVLQDTHRTSVTGMTGELGSAVTGSPNLNLTTGSIGSGVTFPAGHVIQTKHYTSTIANGTSTNVPPTPTDGLSLGYVHITPLQANSLIWITAHWSYNFSRVANYQSVLWWLGYKIGSGNQSGEFTQWRRYFADYDGVDDGSDDLYRHPTLNVIHDPTYTLGQTISYEQKLGASRGSSSVNYPTTYARNDSGGTNPPSWIGVQEIAQ